MKDMDKNSLDFFPFFFFLVKINNREFYNWWRGPHFNNVILNDNMMTIHR